MSPECAALMALRQPPAVPSTGDLWLCRRLGIVKAFLKHKRGSKRGRWPTDFHIYHWGKLSMWAAPDDFREDGVNANLFFPDKNNSEIWEYLGNISDWLPYATLTGAPT